jgi:hypothetical protein
LPSQPHAIRFSPFDENNVLPETAFAADDAQTAEPWIEDHQK